MMDEIGALVGVKKSVRNLWSHHESFWSLCMALGALQVTPWDAKGASRGGVIDSNSGKDLQAKPREG